MGADCHDFFIEQKLYDGPWWFVGQINTDRDYTAFGVLAGVRDEGLEYIDPRGYPELTSWAVEEHREKWAGDCHSETWLTTDEMVNAQVRYANATGGSYAALAYAINLMRMAEARYPDKPVRAVFCFDN